MDIKQILVNLIGEALGILLLLVIFALVLFWAKFKADRTEAVQNEADNTDQGDEPE